MSNLLEKIKKHIQIGTKLYNKSPEIGTSLSSRNLKNIEVVLGDDIIDEDLLTPRAFDRTKKSMGMKSFVMNKSGNGIDKNQINECGEDDIKSNGNIEGTNSDGIHTDRNYISVNDVDNFGNSNNLLDEDDDEEEDESDNNRRLHRDNHVHLDYSDQPDDKNGGINGNDKTQNDIYNLAKNTSNHVMEKSQSTFMNNGWQTPKKSNVGSYYSGIDNPSTLKKYKTPCEMDMLHPDESLIGNKCITINNYVNPPKYVAPVVTPSKFPLSGENNPHMTYEDFKGLFKHKACIISEHEFNSNKSSNNIDNGDRKYLEYFNTSYENNSWPNKKEVCQSIKKISSKFYNNERDSPKSRKRKVDSNSKLSTKKILDVLVGNDKNKSENNSNNTTSSSCSINKYMKKGKNQNNEKDDDMKKNKNDVELIDYEINPIIKTEKNKAQNENIPMQDMAKQKQNPLTPLYEPYSKELDIIFNKNIIKTPIILLNIYQYLLVVISRRNQKNQPIFYQLIKQEVINLNPCRCFSEESLKQLAWLAPNLIQLNKVVITKEIFETNQQIYADYVTGKKIEDIQIREHTENCENIYKYTSADKLEMLKRIIINWANVKHNELLKKINPDFYCAKYSELKKWHSTFNFNDIIFPSVTLEENKMLAQLAQTPQESNADDFIVIQDSPIKCATIDLRKNGTFIKEMEKEKTRTPLGKNRKKANYMMNSFINTHNNKEDTPKKKETNNMKLIREEANKKNILKEIKVEFDKEHETLLIEKKKFENAKWIAEIIHEAFVVEGTYTVIELNTFSKKIAEKYKSNKNFQMDQSKISQIIEILPNYITDISIKPSMMNKSNMNLSVKSKKNLYNFLEPLTIKINDITKKYQELKNNKDSRLNELWKKFNVNFDLTEKIKKYFLTPGSIGLSEL
ncbi:CDT1-like protein [Plasmodium brasilianum]|uniref:CDT1-like protein n=1 Tax=Plasmodium brasilianum TaxID=5824 RepID=A0ACB9Y6H0_PLABR|nr:CDT1-like protein [Plasmodium brasilianum]